MGVIGLGTLPVQVVQTLPFTHTWWLATSRLRAVASHNFHTWKVPFVCRNVNVARTTLYYYFTICMYYSEILNHNSEVLIGVTLSHCSYTGLGSISSSIAFCIVYVHGVCVCSYMCGNVCVRVCAQYTLANAWPPFMALDTRNTLSHKW